MGEIQPHTDAVGIVEEDLGIARAWHDAFAEFHIPGLQPLAYTLNIRRGKGDMVEAAGVVELFLSAARASRYPTGIANKNSRSRVPDWTEAGTEP